VKSIDKQLNPPQPKSAKQLLIDLKEFNDALQKTQESRLKAVGAERKRLYRDMITHLEDLASSIPETITSKDKHYADADEITHLSNSISEAQGLLRGEIGLFDDFRKADAHVEVSITLAVCALDSLYSAAHEAYEKTEKAIVEDFQSHIETLKKRLETTKKRPMDITPEEIKNFRYEIQGYLTRTMEKFKTQFDQIKCDDGGKLIETFEGLGKELIGEIQEFEWAAAYMKEKEGLKDFLAKTAEPELNRSQYYHYRDKIQKLEKYLFEPIPLPFLFGHEDKIKGLITRIKANLHI